METEFWCPNCKKPLISNEESYDCKTCNNSFKIKNGFIDFVNEGSNIKDEKLLNLIEKIDKKGYQEGLNSFLIENPTFKKDFTETKIFQSCDGVFHVLSDNNKRCLEVGSNFGNIAGMLSQLYSDVYSLDEVKENIEFQTKRFQNEKKSNICLVRAKLTHLPFPDEFFDLVVCHGTIEKLNKFYSSQNQKRIKQLFLTEIHRILNDKGILLLSANNKFGINILYNKARKKPVYSSSHSLFWYQSLLKKIGFKTNSYWSLPSFEIPYYSANLNDEHSISWFLHNLDNFIPTIRKFTKKKTVFLWILKHLHSKLLRCFIQIFSPSFLFICYKNKISTNIESIIATKTGFKDILTLSRRFKIIFIVFDKHGKPRKVASIKKLGFVFSSAVIMSNKIEKVDPDSNKKIWIEDWQHGRILDMQNKDEIMMAIKWIISFQKDTIGEPLSENEIRKEVSSLNSGIMHIPELNKPIFTKWVNDYERCLNENKINKSSVHGDLSYRNILLNTNTNQIHVIDWFNFEKNGNPFYDISMFMYRLFRIETKNHSELANRINGKDKKFNEFLKEIEIILSEHFRFKVDLFMLIRVYLLRGIIQKKQKNESIEDELKLIQNLVYSEHNS